MSKRTSASLRISLYIYMSNDCPNRVKPVRRPFITLPPGSVKTIHFPFFFSFFVASYFIRFMQLKMCRHRLRIKPKYTE